MTDKILYWMSVLFSGLALLLLVVNTTLVKSNRDLQVEMSNRQASINAASNLTPLNQNLAQALAEVSLKNDDTDIRDLLTSQGITIRKPDVKADTDSKAVAKKKPVEDKKNQTEE